MTAHRNRAKNVGGTTIPLIQKRMRSLEIGMRASAVWRNQYRNKQSKPAAASLSVTRKYTEKNVTYSLYQCSQVDDSGR
jgi:hypothetical protein